MFSHIAYRKDRCWQKFLKPLRILFHGIVELKFFCNFATADRHADHACWERLNRSPVRGKAERDVVKIHKKAFIRADS